MCSNFWYDLCALQANKQKRSRAGPQQMSNLWLIWPVLCVHLDSWQERTVRSWARRPQEFKERVGSSNWGCLSEMYLSLLNLQQWAGNLSAPGLPSRMSRNITISCFSYHKLHLFLKSRHLWPQWTKTEKEVNKNYSILKMLCVQTFCALHIYANTSKIRYEFFREASLYADSACRSPGKTLSVAPSTPNQLPCRKSPLPSENLVQCEGAATSFTVYAVRPEPLLRPVCILFPPKSRVQPTPFSPVYLHLVIISVNSSHP